MVIEVTETRTWTIEVVLAEDDSRTRADAVLRTAAHGELRGQGHARRNPADPPVPEIGDEIAASRALSDLAHKLLDTAAGTIEATTHKPAHLRE